MAGLVLLDGALRAVLRSGGASAHPYSQPDQRVYPDRHTGNRHALHDTLYGPLTFCVPGMGDSAAREPVLAPPRRVLGDGVDYGLVIPDENERRIRCRAPLLRFG